MGARSAAGRRLACEGIFRVGLYPDFLFHISPIIAANGSRGTAWRNRGRPAVKEGFASYRAPTSCRTGAKNEGDISPLTWRCTSSTGSRRFRLPHLQHPHFHLPKTFCQQNPPHRDAVEGDLCFRELIISLHVPRNHRSLCSRGRCRLL